MTPLEDRTVPANTSVSLGQITNAAEGGTDGTVVFTRSSTIGSLPVNYTVGGTATAGTDYTTLSGTVTFANGSATATVSVHAFHDGLLDPNETVIVTVASGSGYLIGLNDSATLTLIDTDILPEAFDGSVTTGVNTDVEVDVLDLSTSLYGDTLTVTAVTQGADGTVVDNLDGTVTYTPDTDFTGEDEFTYTVEDQFGNEATGTVTVSVTAVEAPPTSVWTATNTAVTVAVLDMAFDPDGDSVTTASVTQGSYGTVTLNGNGTVTYTPNTSYTGNDSFTYTVEDGDGNDATGTITVTVGATNPVALDDNATTATNTAVTVDVLDLAYQPAGGSLSTTAVTQGSYGSVSINGNGTVTYTPNTSYTGTDTFTYTVTDANSNTDTGTITVHVGAVSPSPADEITEDLEGIENEIEYADEDTPDILESELPDLAEAISDYLGDVTSYIDANSVGAHGANLTVTAFFAQLTAYRELHNQYASLLAFESALNTILLGNKALIESIDGQIDAAQMVNPPNKDLITGLLGEVAVLSSVQTTLVADVYIPLIRTMDKTYKELTSKYNALRADAPRALWLQQIISPPTAPPQRLLTSFVPKD